MTINAPEDSAIRQAAAALMPQLKDDLMQLARIPSVATDGWFVWPLVVAYFVIICGVLGIAAAVG